MNYKPAVLGATWLPVPTVFNGASEIARQSATYISGVISRRRYKSVTPVANGPEKPSRRCRQIPRYYLQLCSMASLFLRTARGLQYLPGERRTQPWLLRMMRTNGVFVVGAGVATTTNTHVGIKDRAGFCSAPQQFCHTIRELFSTKGLMHNGKRACNDVTEGTLRSIIGQAGEKYRGQLRKAPLCLLY
jgi:hypothetical protein